MTELRRCLLIVPLATIVAVSLADDKPARPTNRLAKESSPYLLHHAHNPVEWYPWGEEAFARAKKEGKLIFLSSGYSSCHWCHVMERESFSDEGVAEVMNTHFVCIKLDREERPEVDHLYLTALNAMGNDGGWPLSMFITADGKPIVGGTYWPREDREIQGQTIAGFKSVLKAVIDAQDGDATLIEKTAALRADQTKRLLRLGIKPGTDVEINRDLVAAAATQLEKTFDPAHGGFGSPPNFRGPKFPRPPLLRLLQAEAVRTKSEKLDAMLHSTLEKLARGGIYDQLGGGFHRYSTERTWTVPHFEKMLYDNSQLLEVYARAYKETKKELYRQVLQETLAFVERELTSPEGAFYTALDADTGGEEGRFYVWTDEELATAVNDAEDLAFLKTMYGADGPPNFEEAYHILVLANPPEGEGASRLARLKATLMEARGKRPRPALDTKVLTSWNGQMIAGMAAAGDALGDKAVVQRAAKAADFLLRTMKTAEGRLLHAYAAVPGEQAQARLNGYLDDYVHLVHGLLAMHEFTGEDRWLVEARSLTDTQIALFHDDTEGGFFFTSSDHEEFFARIKDQHDGVQPCGNSQAAANLVRLWRKTGDQKYRDLAARTFRTFAASLQDDPRGMCTLAEALGEYLDATAGNESKEK